MRQSYGSVATEYRQNDEDDAEGADHRSIGSTLQRVTASFDRPIRALDVGCGTGRYFHCLRNVKKLVGIDVSPEMLELARNPVRKEEVSVPEIELFCANAYTTAFPKGSFELIYSFGVFGNGCAVTRDLCNKFYDWLTPDGVLFFDAIDISGVPAALKMKKRVRQWIYSALPEKLQDAWDDRTGWLPFFLTTKKDLERLMKRTHFPSCVVEAKTSKLTLGTGTKLQVLAAKATNASSFLAGETQFATTGISK